MNLVVCDFEPAAFPPSDQPNIVRRFLSWAQRADAGGRAEAASALARAYLYSDLGAALRREAAIGMTSLLDDHSALVRRALAEALAGASDAPHHIVLALASDQSEISSVVLARSPVLTEIPILHIPDHSPDEGSIFRGKTWLIKRVKARRGTAAIRTRNGSASRPMTACL